MLQLNYILVWFGAGILSDLFPGVTLPDIDYTDLLAALTENSVKQGLQPLESFKEKIIQLYEMIIVRHGLMLVRADDRIGVLLLSCVVPSNRVNGLEA